MKYLSFLASRIYFEIFEKNTILMNTLYIIVKYTWCNRWIVSVQWAAQRQEYYQASNPNWKEWKVCSMVKYQGQVSRSSTRVKYQGQVSRSNIRVKYQGQVSGSSIRVKYQIMHKPKIKYIIYRCKLNQSSNAAKTKVKLKAPNLAKIYRKSLHIKRSFSNIKLR